MTYWIITDLHFGHTEKMMEYCDRPKNYADRILDNLAEVTRIDDVLICLGDICWGDDEAWHQRIAESTCHTRWLIRGNHDGKSDSWYLSHGWCCVAEQLVIKRFAKTIVFSHIPIADWGYDLNIHGHFHNSDHRRHEPELVAIKNGKQVSLMMEHHYRAFNLQKICELTTERGE